VPEQCFPEMLNRVKSEAVNKRRAITDEEFRQIANAMMH